MAAGKPSTRPPVPPVLIGDPPFNSPFASVLNGTTYFAVTDIPENLITQMAQWSLTDISDSGAVVKSNDAGIAHLHNWISGTDRSVKNRRAVIQNYTLLYLGYKTTYGLADTLGAVAGKADSLTGTVATTNLSPVPDITNFFGLITSQTFWVRVGEVVFGLIVVGVGVNAVMKESTGKSAGNIVSPVRSIAKAVNKPAPPPPRPPNQIYHYHYHGSK